MEITRDGNLASERIGKLWLAASGRRAIADETWREYLDHAANSVTRDGPYHGVLFYAPKHGPSASHRKMLTHEYARAVRLDLQRRVALISDSAIVRGAITAINWFTRTNLVAFPPREARHALDWLAEDIAFDRSQAEHALDHIISVVQGETRKSGTA